MGPQVQELETTLAARAGSQHCIAMGSGTDALLAALLACDVGPGDRVITVPFTWISTAEVILLLGAIPVFIDISADTYTMDPQLLENYLEHCDYDEYVSLKAVVPVDIYGCAADYDRINAVAARFAIPVISDAAQSFGLPSNGAAITCTSFFPTKTLGCYGDGGACFTNSDKLAKNLRKVRSHGGLKRFDHTRIGFNGRLDTLQAAILLVKLKYFDNALAKRRAHTEAYSKALEELEWLELPVSRGKEQHVYGQYTVRIKDGLRDHVKEWLENKCLPCAVFYPVPLHHQPVFRGRAEMGSDLTVSETACKEVLSLPLYPEFTVEERDKVIEAISNFNPKNAKEALDFFPDQQ